jgi:hypothetical protein
MGNLPENSRRLAAQMESKNKEENRSPPSHDDSVQLGGRPAPIVRLRTLTAA